MTFWNDTLAEGKGPKILVAAPTFSGMHYCLKEWCDAYHAFHYENKGALLVDNSDANLHYAHLIRAQKIDCIYQQKRFPFLWDTLELGWRIIVDYAHERGYDLIASIEQDIICPPETLDVLYEAYRKHGPKCVVAHRYHPRGIDNPQVPEGMRIDQEKYDQLRAEHWFDTLGCVLIPTELLYESRDRWMAIFESEIYILAKNAGYERVRLKDTLDVRHLENYEKKKEPPKLNTDRLHPAELTVTKPDEPSPWGGRRSESPIMQQSIPTPVVWECQRCGRCCEEFVMRSATDGAKDFWGLHGLPVRTLDNGQVEATLHADCEWLTFEDGKAVCKNYDQRPGTCRRYTCEGMEVEK